MAKRMQHPMPDEVARIGALSNGSNGQRSLESASLHFEPVCRRERSEAEGGRARHPECLFGRDLDLVNLQLSPSLHFAAEAFSIQAPAGLFMSSAIDPVCKSGATVHEGDERWEFRNGCGSQWWFWAQVPGCCLSPGISLP